MIKTTLEQVVFCEFVRDGNEYHFAADWNEPDSRFTRQLNFQVRKILEAKAKAKFGRHDAATGSSAIVYLDPVTHQA